MLKKVVVENRWGIHAEVASRLVALTKKYKSHIFIKHQKKTASLMNMVQLLALGVKYGDEIILIADGEDEAEAIAEAISVIQHVNIKE